MTKPLVFVSHVTAEADVAILLKDLIAAQFLGLMDVFVSSDAQTIAMGQRWLDSITTALKECVIEIIIASPQSVPRPWVNFEAGAAWVRGIPVIPLCHSGVTPSTLPLPLNLLQGAYATDAADLARVFDVLATALGAKTPKTDFSKFIADVSAFEMQYTFWNGCNAAFQGIHNVLPGIIAQMIRGGGVVMMLDDATLAAIEPHANVLCHHGVLQFRPRTATAVGSPGGTQYRAEFLRGPQFTSVTGDPHFRMPR